MTERKGRPRHVLFDLDGTLTDSRPGIFHCYRHALAELGRSAPPDDKLLTCVGPPLAQCFATLLGTTDAATIERAIASYRERFERQGMFESQVYPGVVQALTTLTAAGHVLQVVTSKPAPYAKRILQHHALASFFRGIHGPELADRNFTKAVLVRRALTSRDASRRFVWLVGDRADDIRAAASNDVRSIGAAWGYGSHEELSLAGADALAESPSAVVDYIAREA